MRKLPMPHPEFHGVPVWQRGAPAQKRVGAGWWLLLRSERARRARDRVAATERSPGAAAREARRGGEQAAETADRTRRSHVRGGHRSGLPELLHRRGAERRHRDHRQRVQRPLHPVSSAPLTAISGASRRHRLRAPGSAAAATPPPPAAAAASAPHHKAASRRHLSRLPGCRCCSRASLAQASRGFPTTAWRPLRFHPPSPPPSFETHGASPRAGTAFFASPK